MAAILEEIDDAAASSDSTSPIYDFTTPPPMHSMSPTPSEEYEASHSVDRTSHPIAVSAESTPVLADLNPTVSPTLDVERATILPSIMHPMSLIRRLYSTPNVSNAKNPSTRMIPEDVVQRRDPKEVQNSMGRSAKITTRSQTKRNRDDSGEVELERPSETKKPKIDATPVPARPRRAAKPVPNKDSRNTQSRSHERKPKIAAKVSREQTTEIVEPDPDADFCRELEAQIIFYEALLSLSRHHTSRPPAS